jgi:hypothetical protein
VAKGTARATVEAALTAGVGAGYLAVDVTYTAYAGNAYITPTPRAALLEGGRARLEVVGLVARGAGGGDAPAARAGGAKRARGKEEDDPIVVSDDE